MDYYDPLENAPTLVLYLAKDGEDWVQIDSIDPVIGSQLTRVLQVSHDYRNKSERRVRVGERLTYSQPQEDSPWKAYNITPSDWVVSKVVRHEPQDLSELPEFQGVTIAYCERQPLSVEEKNRMTRSTVSAVSIDSFGGDREAFESFLATDAAKQYVVM